MQQEALVGIGTLAYLRDHAANEAVQLAFAKAFLERFADGWR
jgi:hypothetical protein